MSRSPSYHDMTAKVHASLLHKMLAPAAKDITGDLRHLSELILALPGRCGLVSVTCKSPVMAVWGEGQQRSEQEASAATAMTSSFLLEMEDACVPMLPVGAGIELDEGHSDIHAFISFQTSLFKEAFPFYMLLNKEGLVLQVSFYFHSADSSECALRTSCHYPWKAGPGLQKTLGDLKGQKFTESFQVS